MTYIDSIILGIVEGITEFLPVSSTGHLILASNLLGLLQSDFVKSFEIAIQLGAILAVVFVYWRSFLNFELLKKLFVAFLPTAVIGFVLYHFVKSVLIGNTAVVLYALLVGGIILLLVEWFHTKNESDMPVTAISYWKSFIIGCAQAVAVIPGVSRSGATAVGGLLLNIPRATILEFSFLLAVPTMLAATGYDLIKTPDVLFGANLGLLAVGFIVAFVVAFAVIKIALSFVRRYTFIPFALYRILIALLFLFFIT